VAFKTGDVFLEKISSSTMLYLQWMAEEGYNIKDVGVPISPEDVCDTIIHEVSEIKDLLEACEVPIRTWSMRRHGRIVDEIEDSLQNEDNDDDSSYHPSGKESDSDNSIDSTSLPGKSAGSRKRKQKPASDKSQTAAISQSISNRDATSQPSPERTRQSNAADQQQEAQPERFSTSPVGKQTPKATGSKTGKRQHHAKRPGHGKRKQTPASDECQTAAISQSVSNAEATSQPSPKRTKQSNVTDQQQEAQPGRSSTSPVGKQTPKAMASKTGKRQHHAKRPCPVCGKDEGNLKRHLKSHVKKGLIEENQVDKLLAVAIHQGKTRGPGRAGHLAPPPKRV